MIVLRVKLCGIRSFDDVDILNEVHPDYAGFVFAGAKHRIDDDTAAALRSRLDDIIPVVGVFQDEPLEHIAALVRSGTIQAVQLHGHEDVAGIEAAKELHVPVIKAFSIGGYRDIERAAESPADYILLDHGSGGSGTSFDWSLLTKIDRPFFLAGGLSVSNIRDAIKLNPYALDVSSGVETNGRKDAKKIRQFMKIAGGR